jgi:hypothetical protein
MREHFFVAAKKVLGLRTNVRKLRWSFGTVMPPVTKEEYEACEVRLQLNVGKVQIPSKKSNFGKYHYFSGVPGTDIIYYQRPFLFNTWLEIEAKGLLSNEPMVRVNKIYYHFVHYRFMNVHSIGYILTDLASFLLLQRGYAPLHCSAFRKGDSTVLVFAPPNTGKTLCTMVACMEYGAEFLAEDLAITNGEKAYSVPWTSTFRYYSTLGKRPVSRIFNTFSRLFPPLELLPIYKPKPVSAYLDGEKIVESSKITHLIILERGSTLVQKETPEEAYRKILNLNHYEFNYFKNPLIIAYEFFNPSLNIAAAYMAEKNILKKLINNVDERLMIRASDPIKYASLVLNSLK